MPVLLDVQDASVRHGQLIAVRQVSFQVEAGTVVSIVGPNGAGKTSLLEALAGINSIAEGTVQFAGVGLAHLSPVERVSRGVVLCPEGRRLFGPLTVTENLRIAHGAKRNAPPYSDALESVLGILPEIARFLKQRAGSLSGGEQQLVALGRALIASPSLLLLDEPTLGLAPRNAERVMEVVSDLRRAGTAVLLVEENVELAFAASDVTHVMVNAQLVLSTKTGGATTADIFEAMVFGLAAVSPGHDN